MKRGTDVSAGFRSAMRRMAASVSIVTVRDAGAPLGMTATAISSVSADPPSLLVCINKSASMHRALLEAPAFCVNILHQDQIALARMFSNVADRKVRFATGDWAHERGHPPYLRDAQAAVICERTELFGFATHTICIGTVREVRVRDDVDPLLYVDGNFVRVA